MEDETATTTTRTTGRRRGKTPSRLENIEKETENVVSS